MGAAEKKDELDQYSFEFLRGVLQRLGGIALSEAKVDLVTVRLHQRLAALGCPSYRKYVAFLKSLPEQHPEWQLFLNCMTTNKTDFFREGAHFDFLQSEIIPAWLKKRRKQPWHFWSVPCSTGEEPYTLAMVLDAALAECNVDYTIAASDIDTQVLAVAQNGVYRKSRLTEIPAKFHKRAFSFGTAEIKDWISVKPHLKEKITFKQCNLIAPPYPWGYRFDAIFCRNVLIYFSATTVAEVIGHLYEAAAPGAFLFVGHSEALQDHLAGWSRICPSIYQKKE